MLKEILLNNYNHKTSLILNCYSLFVFLCDIFVKDLIFMKTQIEKGKKVILFDGVCNLCNSSVNRVIKWDKKDVFLFASLQSDFGKGLITKLHIDTKHTDSIILYEPGISYDIKSTAILKITNDLGGFWKLMAVFFIIPTPIRDWVYDFIARNRYKWYGKKDSCMIPTPELKAKFLDE